jgi:hypothetical protein
MRAGRRQVLTFFFLRLALRLRLAGADQAQLREAQARPFPPALKPSRSSPRRSPTPAPYKPDAHLCTAHAPRAGAQAVLKAPLYGSLALLGALWAAALSGVLPGAFGCGDPTWRALLAALALVLAALATGAAAMLRARAARRAAGRGAASWNALLALAGVMSLAATVGAPPRPRAPAPPRPRAPAPPRVRGSSVRGSPPLCA